MRPASLTSAPLLLTIVALTGCGSSDSIRVSGQLVKGGTPFSAPSGYSLGVTLYALEVADAKGKISTTKEPYPAAVEDDGTFEVPGPDGRGIPPGKYRVSLSQKYERGALPKTPKGAKKPVDREVDLLAGPFGPESSPIVRELKSSGELVIDLDNPGK